uniref:Uncharacterized protein n=1 Tax=Solanum tuberosum TaxID=4113 RepID=M1DKI9_SOLTU
MPTFMGCLALYEPSRGLWDEVGPGVDSAYPPQAPPQDMVPFTARMGFHEGCHGSADHSATLVGIADQLDDSPFGVIHRRLAPSFGIVVLWVIGRHSTSSQNFLAMRRLLPFFVDLILSFRLITLEQKAK